MCLAANALSLYLMGDVCEMERVRSQSIVNGHARRVSSITFVTFIVVNLLPLSSDNLTVGPLKHYIGPRDAKRLRLAYHRMVLHRCTG